MLSEVLAQAADSEATLQMANCGVSAGQWDKKGNEKRLILTPLLCSFASNMLFSGVTGTLTVEHKMGNVVPSSLGA